jgi:hypothetical protein
MDEHIEIRDVDGNLVKVSLFGALTLIGETLRDEEHTRSVTRADGKQVEVRLVPHFDPGLLAD